VKRILGIAVIAAAAVAGVVAAVSYTPAAPTDCTVLLRQSEHMSDVGTLIEEAGCEPAPAGVDLTARP
jgi:hypothetical protein